MPATSLTTSSKKSISTKLPSVRGISAWLAIVRTYQQCSETLIVGIKPLGIKLAQHDVMMNLLQSQALTQQELAQKSFVTKSHMSAVLMEMEDAGWVSREGSEQDKRSKVITLTPQGMRVAMQAWQVQAQVVHAMMDPLSNAQIKELQGFSQDAHQALVKLSAALSQAS